MLKPITEQEKAEFTLKLQFEKAVMELLTEAYEAGYTGYLDLYPSMEARRGQLVLEVKVTKVPTSSHKLSDQNALRFHVQQGKGFKRVK